MDHGQWSSIFLTFVKKNMRIGEISNETGVSRDTVRLYERMGLLEKVTRPHEWNNYKEYDQENVKRIKLILSLKSFGFTLKECKEVLSLMDGDTIDEEIRAKLIYGKIDEIERKIEELSSTKQLLLLVLNKRDCTQ